jgi:hypothetical protein
MSQAQQSGVPPADAAGRSASPPHRWMPQCPQCGSTSVRKPTKPLLVNIIACVICLPLTLIACAMALPAMVSLLALPITTGIALLGRHRCLSCQHRFELDPQSVGHPALPGFPWRWHALNIVILVLLCFVVPHIMRKGAGAGRLSNAMVDLGIFMTLGFFLWASLLYHLILHRMLRHRLFRPLIWAILFILPGLIIGGRVSYRLSPKVQARALLQYAGLAPLPPSATGIRVYSWSSPFSGEDFLRFTADPNDIERFLLESPALQGQEPRRFSAQQMRLKYPKDYLANSDDRQDGNTYYFPRSTTPMWYKQEVRGSARKYIVRPPRYQFPGEVLVDDETSTVYVYLCFS